MEAQKFKVNLGYRTSSRPDQITGFISKTIKIQIFIE